MARLVYALRAAFFMDRGDLFAVERVGVDGGHLPHHPPAAGIPVPDRIGRISPADAFLYPKMRAFHGVRGAGLAGAAGVHPGSDRISAAAAIFIRLCRGVSDRRPRRVQPAFYLFANRFDLGCGPGHHRRGICGRGLVSFISQKSS